jgi:hypothetical protein
MKREDAPLELNRIVGKASAYHPSEAKKIAPLKQAKVVAISTKQAAD